VIKGLMLLHEGISMKRTRKKEGIQHVSYKIQEEEKRSATGQNTAYLIKIRCLLGHVLWGRLVFHYCRAIFVYNCFLREVFPLFLFGSHSSNFVLN
jgi:hypothetical protein